jgi:hypothetical protein
MFLTAGLRLLTNAVGPQVMMCLFAEGPSFVAVHQGPVKGLARMREKLLEYAHAGDAWADWPLTANILDPIRTTIVCNGPSQILQASPRPFPHIRAPALQVYLSHAGGCGMLVPHPASLSTACYWRHDGALREQL